MIPCVVYVERVGEKVPVGYTATYWGAKRLAKKVGKFYDYIGITEAWNWPQMNRKIIPITDEEY